MSLVDILTFRVALQTEEKGSRLVKITEKPQDRVLSGPTGENVNRNLERGRVPCRRVDRRWIRVLSLLNKVVG